VNISLASSLNDPSGFNALHLKIVLPTRVREVCVRIPTKIQLGGFLQSPQNNSGTVF
jgi:hypothetical protein